MPVPGDATLRPSAFGTPDAATPITMSLRSRTLVSSLALLTLAPATALAQDYYYESDGAWSWGWGSAVSYFLAWLGMTVATGLLAAAFAWLTPHRTREAIYDTARREAGSSVGAGLLIAIALPLLGLALVLTVIGAPLGLAVWIASVLVAFVGFVASAWIFGRALAARSRAGNRLSHIGWLFVALAILCALSLIPIVGTLLWIAASVYGTGAIAMATYRARQAQLPRDRRAPPPGAPPAPGTTTQPGYPAPEHPAGA